MKKLVTFSLLALISIGGGVVVVKNIVPSNQASQSIQKGTAANSSGTASMVLSKVELAKHSSGQSCWLLISGKIYDVTSFLPNHPGEAKAILPTCGIDATAAYNTKGQPGGKPHSTSAAALLADFFIGNLDQTVSADSVSAAKAGPNAATPSGATQSWDDDEFDD